MKGRYYLDIRDAIHTQLEEHIKSIRNIAKQPAPPQLVWEEMQRYLEESAMHLELFILPKVPVVTPHLDLRTGLMGSQNKIAEIVGIAGKDPEPDVPGFLNPPKEVKA